MEEYCQNETMKKLRQRDPFLYYKIMSYERQYVEDAKEVESFMCTYRQSSINILRKVQLRQKNQNEENQYKFPINNRLKNMNRLFQREVDQQTDPEFQILKKRKYNLYEQNKQRIKESNQTNKRGSSSCIKKRGLFVIKKKENINNYSESASKCDSFQLNSPKQIYSKKNTKQVLKYSDLKQNLKKLSMPNQKNDILNKWQDQKALSKIKYKYNSSQNGNNSSSTSKETSQNVYNRLKQSRLGRTYHSSSQKEKTLSRESEENQIKRNKYGMDEVQYVIIKKGGVINGNYAHKSRFLEMNKKNCTN